MRLAHLCNDKQVTPPPASTSTPTVERSSFPTVVVVLLSVATFVAMTSETLPVGLIQAISRGLAVPIDHVGLLVTVYGGVVAVGAIPLTALVSRWPHERAMPVVMVVFAASCLVAGLSTDLATALVARVVGGTAHAVFFSIAFATMVVRTAPHRRGRAATALGGGNALALVLGIPAATALGTSTSWRVPFLVSSGCFLVLAVLTHVVLRGYPAVHHTGATSARAVVRAAFSRPMLKIALALVLTMTAHFATYTYISPVIVHAGIWESAVAMVLLAYGVVGAASLFGTAVVADRAPSAGLRGTIALTLLCLVGLWFAQGSALGAVVAVAVWGAAFGAAPALWQLVALHAAPHEPGAGPAVVNASFNVGIALGAWGGGMVIEQRGPGTLVLGSTLIAAVALGVVLLPRWFPRDVTTVLATERSPQERSPREHSLP